MLELLDLHDTGPAPSMKLELSPRLNLLVGDNSLGKTFVLDVAWWALTVTWIGEPQEAPPDFDDKVRVPGLRALAELRGDQAALDRLPAPEDPSRKSAHRSGTSKGRPWLSQGWPLLGR